MDKQALELLIKELLKDNTTESCVRATSKNVVDDDNSSEIIGEDFIWEYVILRWYDSWVHFWKLVKARKWYYVLDESRRLWRFWNKKGIWLTDLAQYWLADRDEVKICATIPKIAITEDRVSEIIPVTTKKIIKHFKEYKVAEQY